jgi:hypothetical protein
MPPALLTYEEKLSLIDNEIQRLILMRNDLILHKARADELQAMRERGIMLSDMLRKAATFADAVQATSYIIEFILPWRTYLPQRYFPNTLQFIPEELPENWNIMEACIMILGIEDALDRDRAALNEST